MTIEMLRKNRPFDNDDAWKDLRLQWVIRPDTTYLNHGSFGPSPLPVRFVRKKWIEQLDQQPMDFYVRELEGHLWAARTKLGEFIGTSPNNLIFVDNATYGMNVIANSFYLETNDEILMTNHEYGAVSRIWERACKRAGGKVSVASIPEPMFDPAEIVETLVNSINRHTKMLVISHITSPTGLILPVAEICAAFQKRGVSVCIDGPHAPAHIPFNIDQLGCAFYTASCHKWMCAPLGSGFLYVNPFFQDQIKPPIKSWGRLLPAVPETWDEEFTWIGTRDPSPFLSIPTAIEFLAEIGWDQFRARTFWLAKYAEEKLTQKFETGTIASREQGYYGAMAHIPLPPGDWSSMQQKLWERDQIEIPIILFEDRWFVRFSCHVYNTSQQIDFAISAIEAIVEESR